MRSGLAACEDAIISIASYALGKYTKYGEENTRDYYINPPWPVRRGYALLSL